MQKKIIAACCLIVAVTLIFASCGNKVLIKGSDGKKYIAVTDNEGNTVTDANGNLEVYVTDAKGKYVTEEDGESKKAILTFPEAISNKDSIETVGYILTAPEGWVLDPSGRRLNRDVGNAKIEITDLGKLADGETLETYAQKQMESVVIIAEGMKEKYSDVTYSITPTQFNGKDAQLLKMCVKDGTGVVQDNNLLYFISGNDVYKVLYSTDAEGYDASFDFMTEMQAHIQLK